MGCWASQRVGPNVFRWIKTRLLSICVLKCSECRNECGLPLTVCAATCTAGLAAATRRQHKRPNYAGSPRTLPNSDYSHQMLMLNKLQTRKKPLDKLKTTQAWRRVSGVIFFTAVAAVLICLVRAAAIVVPPVVVTSSVRLGPWVRGLVRFGRNIRLQ